jgi:AcrR family transcriptional regulator
MKSTADPGPRSPGVRERTQAAIRRELAEAALRLFTERGFAETTARQIAAAVGVSERTFFRYFGSKEDVVLGVLDDLGIELAARLAARPADEPPFVALRRSFDLMTETLTRDPEWSLAMLHLTHQIPALRARQVEKQDLWATRLADGLADRMGVDGSLDLRPRLYAATALSALDCVATYWDATGGAQPFGELLDQAFTTAFKTPPGKARRRPNQAALEARTL